jgi:hypothetical protein
VEYSFISDHAPIILQLETVSRYKTYPFKLNPLWVLDKDYKKLFYQVWKDLKYNIELGCQCRLVYKLKEEKIKTKEWAKQREGNLQKCMEFLETQIKDTFLSFVYYYTQ